MRSPFAIFTLLTLLTLFESLGFAAVPVFDKIIGIDVLSNISITTEITNSDSKALAVIFLSATCPCSNSYVVELKQLKEKYPQIRFIGVNSNFSESMEMARDYFKAKNLGFPVIRDAKAAVADQLKAYKTPHAFLFNQKGEIIYQGGVSDSSEASKAKVHLLADAIEDVTLDHKVRTPQGRTLGCVIPRENEKNVW
jgi:thioredoxin-related protein